MAHKSFDDLRFHRGRRRNYLDGLYCSATGQLLLLCGGDGLLDMNLRTTWISPSTEHKRGFTLAELQNLSLEQHWTPESLQTARLLIEQNLTPDRLANPQEDISIKAELEFYRKDGSTMWADTDITLPRDGQGIPTGFVGLSLDTTERREMEEALRENEKNTDF